MKKILFLIFIFFTFNCFAWYPVYSNNEFRLIASGKIQNLYKDFGKDWRIEGQLISVKPVQNIKIGGLFSKGKSDSTIGAHVTYSINPFIDLTVTGDLKSIDDIGGNFVLSGNIFLLKGRCLIKPFVQVDHKFVGEIGFINYFKMQKNIWFHYGLGYSPKIKNLKGHESHSVSILLGTSFFDYKNDK